MNFSERRINISERRIDISEETSDISALETEGFSRLGNERIDAPYKIKRLN
ncbi:MAG: hypothetical protein ACRC2V_02170 [Xenococcaceae cyanobacterium]